MLVFQFKDLLNPTKNFIAFENNFVLIIIKIINFEFNKKNLFYANLNIIWKYIKFKIEYDMQN